MARRSGARDLAGLAALAALGYNFFGPGRDRPKGAAKAPVEDRSRYVNQAGDAVTSDVSPAASMPISPASMPTPEADAATDARVMSAAERSGLDVSPGELAAMSGPAVRPAMAAPARAASSSIAAAYRDPSRKKDVLSPTRAGAGAGRSTGRGGATAAELTEYQRQQERDRMRGRGYGTTYKKGGSVKAKPKKMASGGMTSASKRADGIATKGKTKCKMY